MKSVASGSLTHRPVAESDLDVICGFPQSEEELFFVFPKASFPLLPAHLREAIAQRSDATVVEWDGAVMAFADFYRWETEGSCAIGNVIVSPTARGCGVGRHLIEQMVALAFAKHRASESECVLLQPQYRRPAAVRKIRVSALCH